MHEINSSFSKSLGCRDNKVIIGVDEAGRGPVLGPMVYVAAFTPVKDTRVKELGVDDSKVLKEEHRDSLFKVLCDSDFIGWKGYSCSPQEISESMLRKCKYNLNALAHDVTIQLIKDVIKDGIEVDAVYIDTVGPPKQYQEMLEKLFPRIKITVAKKADSLYPIVSAASIVAKVTRDSILKNWEFKEKIEFARDFGSGYPSDPNTVKWLKNNFHPLFGFPSLIRFSWSTADKIIEDLGIKVKWAKSLDEADQENMDIRGFFKENDTIYSQLGLETVKSVQG